MSLNEIFLPEQQEVNAQVFPVIYEWKGSDELSTSVDWFESQAEWIRAQLLQYGAMLVRGLPVDSPDDFEQLIDRSGFPRMPYIGGAAVRSAVTAGRVLTSNESPSSEPIPFHHEMAQVPNRLILESWLAKGKTCGGASNIDLLEKRRLAGGKTPCGTPRFCELDPFGPLGNLNQNSRIQ